MEALLGFLEDINPDIDYEKEDKLIDGKILDSFSIIRLVSLICDEYDVEMSPKYLVPENFNSMQAMWELIQKLQEE